MTLYRASKFGPLNSKQKTISAQTALFICFWKHTAERKQYCLFLSLDHIRIQFQLHESHAPRWWVKFLGCNDGNDGNWMDMRKVCNTCGLWIIDFSKQGAKKQWEEKSLKTFKIFILCYQTTICFGCSGIAERKKDVRGKNNNDKIYIENPTWKPILKCSGVDVSVRLLWAFS